MLIKYVVFLSFPARIICVPLTMFPSSTSRHRPRSSIHTSRAGHRSRCVRMQISKSLDLDLDSRLVLTLLFTNRVRTLSGKEISLDIEPDYKVR